VNTTRGSLEEISLQGLLPATTYTLRILAHNEHGPGPPSAPPLTLTTQAEVEVPGPLLHSGELAAAAATAGEGGGEVQALLSEGKCTQ
jgi:hypothetical protein